MGISHALHGHDCDHHDKGAGYACAHDHSDDDEGAGGGRRAADPGHNNHARDDQDTEHRRMSRQPGWRGCRPQTRTAMTTIQQLRQRGLLIFCVALYPVFTVFNFYIQIIQSNTVCDTHIHTRI